MKKYLCYLVVFLLGAAACAGGKYVCDNYTSLLPDKSIKDSIKTELVDSIDSIVIDSISSDSLNLALA